MNMTFSAKEALETYSKFEKEVVYSKRNVMTIDDVILSEEVYDKLDAEKLIYIVVDNITDEVVAFSTRAEAEAYQYGEKSEDQKVLDKVLEGPATDNLDAMEEAFEEAREEVKEEEMKEGNRIFKVLLDEANEENGRQAGKILGKILAEAKENEQEVKRAKPYSRAHIIEKSSFTSESEAIHDANQIYFADFPRRKICTVLVTPVSDRRTDRDFVFYKIHRSRGIVAMKISGRYQRTERGDIRFIY